jgi:predicted nuclease of predicted toxin-antitoxin system
MIIADENLDSRITAAIRAIPINVYSIAENWKGASDEEIAAFAQESGNIILTRDKDFSDLVFAHGIKGISVILLRYDIINTQTIINQVVDLLRNDTSQLLGKFITISEHRIRTRSI